MTPSRILVVEDDASILRGIVDNLRFDQFEVLEAADGETGLRLLREEQPDLVILDVMLPQLSGLEVCRRARREGLTTPIIFLTARSEETDRIVGLDLGADDYVTKPFSVGELIARVRAVLRRTDHAPDGVAEVWFGDARVDFHAFEAQRGDERIDLTPKEFAVLRYLASRPSQVVRRDALLEDVWGYEADVNSRTVDNHIAALRAKLEGNAHSPRHLITVHGVGYKWVS